MKCKIVQTLMAERYYVSYRYDVGGEMYPYISSIREKIPDYKTILWEGELRESDVEIGKSVLIKELNEVIEIEDILTGTDGFYYILSDKKKVIEDEESRISKMGAEKRLQEILSQRETEKELKQQKKKRGFFR